MLSEYESNFVSIFLLSLRNDKVSQRYVFVMEGQTLSDLYVKSPFLRKGNKIIQELRFFH